MTVVMLRPSRPASRGLRSGGLRSGGLRLAPVQAAMALVFAMIALAVVLQAQRVTGQEVIEDLMVQTDQANRDTAELRAQVAEAESPAEVLVAARSMGMVQPAAVVAVPATGVTEELVPGSANADDGSVG